MILLDLQLLLSERIALQAEENGNVDYWLKFESILCAAKKLRNSQPLGYEKNNHMHGVSLEWRAAFT